MLVRLADLDDVGQYAIAARISSVLLFAATAFALAYSPFILSLYQRDPALEQEFRGRALMIVTTGFLAIAVLLSLFAREVIMLVAPDFDEAYRVVGLIALGLVAFGTTTITMTGISLARKTGRFARYSLLALAVNAALNLLLIPPLGMFGAAIGTLVAFLTLTLLYLRCSQGWLKNVACITPVSSATVAVTSGFIPRRRTGRLVIERTSTTTVAASPAARVAMVRDSRRSPGRCSSRSPTVRSPNRSAAAAAVEGMTFSGCSSMDGRGQRNGACSSVSSSSSREVAKEVATHP